jgi:tetratricopeptide (TPR) repeat protein
MRELPSLRVILRWAFLALGLFLIIRGDLVLNSALTIRPFVQLLFPDNPRSQNIATAAAMIIIFQAGLLCLATAWGLQRGRGWARWGGILACISLLPGVPWFSLIGVAGIFVMLVSPLRPDAEPHQQQMSHTEDYWTAARNSIGQKIVFLLSGALLIAALDGSIWLAQRVGLPEYSLGWRWWLYLVPLALANTAVHEFGHAFMAWAFHHRVQVISIGPFTFSRSTHGRSFQIQWKRLLESSGYMGSVPTSSHHLRLQQISVVAAGPISSLLTGFFMLALFLGLPGTVWQGYWEIVALSGVIAFDYALTSMVPVGYSDGSMIFHLIMRTRPGQFLLDNSLVAQMREDAEAYQDTANFENEIPLREMMLQRALAAGEENAMTIAVCHQSLGYARLVAEDWPGAERELSKCLGFEAECGLNPPLAANAWSLLHVACVERHEVAEASRIYARATTVLEGRKRDRDPLGLAVTKTMQAQLHQRAGSFGEALKEASEALRILRSGRDRLSLRAMLYSVQAESEVCLGSIERGLDAAERAAAIVRSGEIPAGQRNIAWNRLGKLGERLWHAGQSALAMNLLRETIEQLELGGAGTASARQRIRLARIFRQLGRLDEAATCLPKQDSLPIVPVRYLLEERARLELTAERPLGAVAACRELLTLWRTEPDATAETAAAESLLAMACLEAGDNGQAEALAQKAAEVLGPWQHPENVCCRITLALTRPQTGRLRTSSLIDECLLQIQVDPLLLPAEKARFLESEANRLERHRQREEADLLRGAASEHWRTSGVESKPTAGVALPPCTSE